VARPPFGGCREVVALEPASVELEQVRLRAREIRARRLVDRHRHPEAIIELERIVAAEPMREPTWLQLLAALDAAGRPGEAVEAASRYRTRMTAAGLEPSPAFVAAEDQVFRCLSAAAPRPPASHHHSGQPPVRLSSFVGRRHLLDRIDAVLERCRAATLLGPGGVGKTALAGAVARRRHDEHYADGTYLVALAGVDADSHVAAEVARGVGAMITEPLTGAITAHLRDRRCLVILDCGEHVRRGVATVTEVLLACGDQVQVLVTSRRRIGFDGEQVVPVGPLSSGEAVELFGDRAEQAGTAVVGAEAHVAAVRICDRLDRFPLPIEMAAARLRGLDIHDLETQLHQHLGALAHPGAALDERHQTLRSVERWSYQLLDPAQRQVLDELSVFPASFDLTAVESVCAAPAPDRSPGQILADLVDQSLVLAEFGPDGRRRYRMPDTIAVAAAERLDHGGRRTEVTERFIGYYHRLALDIGTGLRGPGVAGWVTRFGADSTNIHAAQQRALELDRRQVAIEISIALFGLVYDWLRADVGSWAESCAESGTEQTAGRDPAIEAIVALNAVNRGDFDEAEARLAPVVAEPATLRHRHAHLVSADLALYRGDLTAAVHHATVLEDLARDAEGRYLAALGAVTGAVALGYQGETSAGLELLARLEQQRPRSPLLAAWLDYSRGEILAFRDPTTALELVDGVAERARGNGWAMLAGVAGLTAVTIRARHGDPRRSVASFEPTITLWRRMNDWTHQRTTLRNLAVVLSRCGRHEPAATLLGVTADSAVFGPEADAVATARRHSRRLLGATAFARLERAGRGMTEDQAVALALDTITEVR
jgi:predicted ATPase